MMTLIPNNINFRKTIPQKLTIEIKELKSIYTPHKTSILSYVTSKTYTLQMES